MKKTAITSILALALTAAFGFGFIPTFERTALCADCESDNLPGIKKAFAAFDEHCKKQLADSRQPRQACFVSNIYNKVLPFIKALAKDNRFGQGNRVLFIGETQRGSLLAGTNHGFQSDAPLDKDSLTVEVNKIDGGNGALVKICTVDENGSMKRVGTIRFEADNSTGVKKATVTGVQGKIVRIDFNSFGSALKKFQYTVKTI